MPPKSASIKSVELTRSLFESIYGNIGLLKFTIDSLVSTNGSDGHESQKWEIVCSLFETLGSQSPTRFKVAVNLVDHTLTLNKLDAEVAPSVYKFTKEEAE